MGVVIKSIYDMFWKIIDAKDKRKYEKSISHQNDNIMLKNWPYGLRVVNENGVYSYKALNCDIIIPKKPIKDPMPIIINIHGGGYTSGCKEFVEKQSLYFASKGYCVVSPNYTLSCQQPFPAPILDMFKVFNFIENHFSKEHFDYNNIFITGSSAGAHIASLCACLLKDKNLMLKYGVNSKINLKACCFQSGLFSVLRFEKVPILNKFPAIICGDDYDKRFTLDDMSPIDIMNSDFPPCLLISGNKDFLFRKQKDFLAKCKSLGVECEHKIITAFDAVHNFNVSAPLSASGKATNNFIVEYFDKFCDFSRNKDSELIRNEQTDFDVVSSVSNENLDFRTNFPQNQVSEYLDLNSELYGHDKNDLTK